MIPTFLGITLMTFTLINLAPGGPIEQRIQSIRFNSESNSRFGSDSSISQTQIEALKKHYGFDKPILHRYLIWLKNISHLDFGDSFTYEEPVIDVIVSKFPVSLQFGLASFILTYLICIPLGVNKAIHAGSKFDHFTSLVLTIAYTIPPLVLGLYLIVFFAGGAYFDWFPIGGLYGDNYENLSLLGRIGDRIHHFVLPLICYVIGNFTELTALTRNSMLDVIKSDYVRTARAKGVSENLVYFKHALRNALIPVATGLGGFFGIFLTGSLIIENMFSLDGIGLLGYKSIMSRDYNVIMGLTFLSSMVLMLGRLFSDFIYILVDPRINFEDSQ